MNLGEHYRIAVQAAKQPQVRKNELKNVRHAIPPDPVADPWLGSVWFGSETRAFGLFRFGFVWVWVVWVFLFLR